MHAEVYRNQRQDPFATNAQARLERLERLHSDLVGRFGDAHPLVRRVSQQLSHAKAAAHVGEEVA